MSRLVKGVASGIGLAREAAAKRSSRSHDSNATSSVERQDNSETESDDSESDDEDWALDEAQNDLPASYVFASDQEKVDSGVDDIVKSFASNYPVQSGFTKSRLPCAVIIPQKRPGNKERGFVKAYAPLLWDCGISQTVFLDFLTSFEKALKANPVFTVITVAAQVVGSVPSVITMGVSIAVTAVNETTKTIQTHVKTNHFLDEMNKALFNPHGLYAMIVAFRPGAKPKAEALDITKVVSKSIGETGSHKMVSSMRNQATVSRGEMEIPDAAPLIFPALDALDVDQKQGQLKKAGHFIAEYYDRRGQATYADQHEGSKLAITPIPEFASRYSDPTHPASSGSLVALLTGGKVNPLQLRAARRTRKNETRADRGMYRLRAGQDPSRREQRAVNSVEGGTSAMSIRERQSRNPDAAHGPVRKFVRRRLNPDVLYLLIVNMPTEEELANAERELQT